ncbi:hypothetical protein [Paenibacillus soyae]|uniref:ABC-2 transporter permease n=1 Tax=Paenibacillus soyae TaxID=2969249 RepID=A0A9X2MT81_9BACL|nr:hypothetical protein [Paenibacillus soyae]MCR2803292.1 hypothetical protein [Paenibacillus soyae]
MTTWQGGWYLAKEEFRRIRWKHVMTIIFIGYLSLFLVPMFADTYEGEEMGMMYWAVDFVTLTLLPCLGFMSTQSFGHYWKSDPYTKKLAAWRVMPIRPNQIVLGRILLFILNALPALIVFFLIFYLVVRMEAPDIELAAFIPFAIMWIGYSIAMGILYIYFEIGFSGKIYFWFCMIFTLGFLIGMIITSLLLKKSLIVESYRLCEEGGWWMALIGLVLVAVSIYIGRPLLEKRLKTRSYSS